MLFACTLLLLFAAVSVRAQGSPFDHEYAVVIEAVSGDTFGSCYRWDRRLAVGDPIVNFKVLGQTQRREPLQYYASVGELASIKAQVTPLLDYCADLIPEASLEHTPAFALLGGGVRGLRVPLQRNVATVVHQALMLSCFRVDDANATMILDPVTEAAMSWQGAGLTADKPIGAYSNVFLADLGDSVAVSRATGAGDATATFLDGSSVSLAAASVSLNAARDPLTNFLRALPDDAASRQTYACLPRNYERSMRIVTKTGQLRNYNVVGSGDAAACEAQLVERMREARNNAGNRISLPAGTYLALGGADEALRRAGSGADATPASLLDGAHTLCDAQWAPLRAAAPAVQPDDAVAFACTRALWIALLLRDVYAPAGDVTLQLESDRLAVRSGAARGFIESRAASLAVGAPPRGVRCEEQRVELYSVTDLPRVILYQCDCITFFNGQIDTVRYISSSELLRDVMPSFASAYLYPPSLVEDNVALYPQSEYRVCSSTNTPVGKYEYTGDVRGVNGTLIVRAQRNFEEEK